MTVPNVQVRQQCEFALIHCQNTMTMYQKKVSYALYIDSCSL